MKADLIVEVIDNLDDDRNKQLRTKNVIMIIHDVEDITTAIEMQNKGQIEEVNIHSIFLDEERALFLIETLTKGIRQFKDSIRQESLLKNIPASTTIN
jgi:hypothetical protein